MFSALAMEAARAELASTSPSRHCVYESGFAAIADDDEAPVSAASSVVVRTVIHDTVLPVSFLDADGEELDYLSLAMDDENVDEADISFQNPSQQIPASSSPPSPFGIIQPPWLHRRSSRNTFVRSPLLELHQEIVAFCELISPTSEEHQLRVAAVEGVTSVIKSIWKQCQVKVFGSFATGLYLPSSDIDMVILDSGCSDAQSGLRALAKAVTKAGIARSIQVIAKARVPIVKFIETESDIYFDVSFDLENGPEAAKFIKDAINAVPPLRPLCLVLKIFLQQRDLNEVYSGGIGSYALLVMLLTYLQTHANQVIKSRLEQNLGVLLVDFLEFFGRLLNFKDVGISCRNGGQFFKKKERGFYDSKRPFMLTVEDPQVPTNDIAKNSFNFQRVRFAFMLAHKQLIAWDGEYTASQFGLLARIVRVDEKLAGRRLTELSSLSPGLGAKRGMNGSKKSRGSKRKRDEQERSLQEGRPGKKRESSEDRPHKKSRSWEGRPGKKRESSEDRRHKKSRSWDRRSRSKFKRRFNGQRQERSLKWKKPKQSDR